MLGSGVTIGANCLIYPNVTLYDGVQLGDRVIVHSGAVIGSDGFGYAHSNVGAVKIQHLGRVIVEADVEIGANTCIDRGTLGDTVIGSRSKIDNLCQIGHNVRIGTDCLIAGMAGISGSTTLGRGGVRVALVEHLLAALAIAGFYHGVVIEVSAEELPILDGSALPFLAAITSLGDAPVPLNPSG